MKNETENSFSPDESEKGSQPDKEEKIVFKVEQLPPLKEGYIRAVHITNPTCVEYILEKGLNYEKYGMISSVTRAWVDESKVEYSSDDPRFSYDSAKAVVLDMPIDEYRKHNNVMESPGVVPPDYIVGIVNSKQSK